MLGASLLSRRLHENAVHVIRGRDGPRARSAARASKAGTGEARGRSCGHFRAAEDGRVPAQPAGVRGAIARDDGRRAAVGPEGPVRRDGRHEDPPARQDALDIAGDRRNERMYYDGKTFTVFGDKAGFYAAFPAPATLTELKDVSRSATPSTSRSPISSTGARSTMEPPPSPGRRASASPTSTAS